MSITQLLAEKTLAALPSQLKKDRAIKDIKLERPTQTDFGDFSSNFALLNFKDVSADFNSPHDLANYIVTQFNKANTDVKAEVAGPGFINLKLADSFFWQMFKQFSNQGFSFLPKEKQSQKVIVEYSSPNIAKPFTIGHLRSTIIGDSIANLFEAMGYTVFRDNHLGDWGTQFGKQIVAIKKWGNEAEIEKSANPVKELVALYVKFHQEAEKDPKLNEEGRAWFKKLESGDPEARALWQKCIDWSLVEFNKIYERLGVKFTENDGRGYGESFFEPFLQDLIKELLDSGLAKEGEEGAKLVFFDHDQYPPLMIEKGDGATLYATRDLATDKWRLEQKRYRGENGEVPLIINEVGAEQSLYFQQIYAIEEKLGWYQAGERRHLKHGLFRFPEGKMSTRKGNVIWLTEVLDKAEEKALTLSPDPSIAQALSIAALKWNDLKRNSELNVNFDWDEILNIQGNSGPYMLYAYARAKSILRKASEQNIDWTGVLEIKELDSNIELNAEEKELIQLLNEFTSILERSQNELATQHLCNYLFNLASQFNTFYHKYQILRPSTGEAARLERDFRLQLVEVVARVIQIGLSILGIKTLERL